MEQECKVNLTPKHKRFLEELLYAYIATKRANEEHREKLRQKRLQLPRLAKKMAALADSITHLKIGPREALHSIATDIPREGYGLDIDMEELTKMLTALSERIKIDTHIPLRQETKHLDDFVVAVIRSLYRDAGGIMRKQGFSSVMFCEFAQLFFEDAKNIRPQLDIPRGVRKRWRKHAKAKNLASVSWNTPDSPIIRIHNMSWAFQKT